ncbi:MAG TPA: electron transport complex subunit RsxE [Spirochaetia bacterium]|nr:MAG: electron transport complex subunit RsxE [Spirochaetes bacterium GWB1_36_13]HCL57765.1 electron transport complex subunit RsxE [Spirochaetia bacterium]
MEKSRWHDFIKGLYRENPILVSMLGLCPTLAVTTQTINGITMGLAVTFVLLGSNIIISLLKNIIPANIRIPSYIVIIATFVTLIRNFLTAYSPDINKALGIFLPLIVVNCIILGRAEAFASKNSLGRSILDALGMGIGFTLVLTFIALVREVIGAGKITLQIADFGKIYDLQDSFSLLGFTDAKGAKAPILIFLLPPGGFILLGLLMGAMNYIQRETKARLEKINARRNKTDDHHNEHHS